MPEADYPKLDLSDGQVSMSICLPDAEKGFYRGTRFDWSGLIARASWAGHSFFGPWRVPHDPSANDCVTGPAEEFAMFHPPGFAEANCGEPFVKIGVGLLAKGQCGVYDYSADYEILQAGTWQIDHGRMWVEFRQQLIGPRHIAYCYAKQIRLLDDAPGFVIEHLLENTGEETIDVLHYNHNFTIIDDEPVGQFYHLELPFNLDDKDSQDDRVKYAGNELVFLEPLAGRCFETSLTNLTGGVADNRFVVSNLKTSTALSVTGDLPVERFDIWAVPTALCPEPFVRIHIQPGQQQRWRISYRFLAGDA